LNSTRFTSRILIAAAAVALTVVAGCAARQVAVPAMPLPPDAALRSLAERDHLLSSLQTPAIMEYSGPSGHLKVREQFTVRRPASLRVDAMSPLGVALIVAADDAQIAVFNPGDNTLMRGPANGATLARFTQIPMAPAQAVQLLLGLLPDDSILTMQPSEIGFGNGQLTMVRARDASGQLTYEVHYSDYRDIGAMKFPFELDAQFLESATTIKLHYLNPSIDRQIADSTFVLSPRPDTRLIQLGFAAPPGLQAGPG
jgi:outer membrane lipoprotein-sorting protein